MDTPSDGTCYSEADPLLVRNHQHSVSAMMDTPSDGTCYSEADPLLVHTVGLAETRELRIGSGAHALSLLHSQSTWFIPRMFCMG